MSGGLSRQVFFRTGFTVHFKKLFGIKTVWSLQRRGRSLKWSYLWNLIALKSYLCASSSWPIGLPGERNKTGRSHSHGGGTLNLSHLNECPMYSRTHDCKVKQDIHSGGQ